MIAPLCIVLEVDVLLFYAVAVAVGFAGAALFAVLAKGAWV